MEREVEAEGNREREREREGEGVSGFVWNKDTDLRQTDSIVETAALFLLQ